MWLEPKCTGQVVFLGGGKIVGLIGDIEFTGTLDAKMEEPIRTVKDMQKDGNGTTRRLTQERSAVGVDGVRVTKTRKMKTKGGVMVWVGMMALLILRRATLITPSYADHARPRT